MNMIIDCHRVEVEGIRDEFSRTFYNGFCVEKIKLFSESEIKVYDYDKYYFETNIVTNFFKTTDKDFIDKTLVTLGESYFKSIETIECSVTDDDKREIDEEINLFYREEREKEIRSYLYNRVYKINNEGCKIYLPLFVSILKPQDVIDKENRLFSEILKRPIFDGYISKYFTDYWLSFQIGLKKVLDNYFDLININASKNDVFNLVMQIQGLKYSDSIMDGNTTLVMSAYNVLDVSLSIYIRAIVDSFLYYAVENKTVNRCENCNSLFPYKNGKKYCSHKCSISAANKRYYDKKQLDIISTELGYKKD